MPEKFRPDAKPFKIERAPIVENKFTQERPKTVDPKSGGFTTQSQSNNKQPAPQPNIPHVSEIEKKPEEGKNEEPVDLGDWGTLLKKPSKGKSKTDVSSPTKHK
jgi:hypothetical protein